MITYRNSTAELSAADLDTAIISVGSTEQCGPHLPMHLDTLVAEYYAHGFGEILGAYVLPTLPFSTAEEHMSFAGTVALRPTTVMLVLEDIVAGLRRQGFRKQVVASGHGGAYWLGPFIKQINWQFADIVVVSAHAGADSIWREAVEGAGLGGRDEIHGGALARALALFLAPEAVTDGDYGRVIPAEMAAYMDYVTWDRITSDGSWGRYTSDDAPVATAEAGRAILTTFVQRQGEHLKGHLAEACRLKGIAE